jgi:hypothetical protein
MDTGDNARRSESRAQSPGNGKTPSLQAFSLSISDRRAARLLPEIARCMPSETTEEVICRANGETGATGLEPATSGVTGRLGRDEDPRRPRLNGAVCRCFSLWRNILSAWLSCSSNRRLGHEWATETCLHGQRHAETRDIPGACELRRRPPARWTDSDSPFAGW